MSTVKTTGQLVRLTTRDYCMLLEACRMADQWRGSKMADEIDEFDEMSNDRWRSLWKIRDAVYTRKSLKP